MRSTAYGARFPQSYSRWSRRMLLCAALAAGSAILAFPRPADAGQGGHYFPGFAGGLKAALVPPPGLYFGNVTLVFNVDRARGPDGLDLPGFDGLTVVANATSILWISKFKLAGARWGTSLAIPISNLAPARKPGDPRPPVGVGDVRLEPIILGWQWGGFQLSGRYSFFLPSGRFRAGATDNVGKGFFSHLFALGFGYAAGGKLPWHASLVLRYETNSAQTDTNVVPGDALFAELGVGLQPLKGFDVGLSAYGLWQVTDDRKPALAGDDKFRVIGLGAEVRYAIPKIPLSLMLRAHREVTGMSAILGTTVFFGLVWASPAGK